MPPLALICSSADLAADQLVLAGRGVGAGQRIVEPDLDCVRGAGANDEGAGDLGRAERRAPMR